MQLQANHYYKPPRSNKLLHRLQSVQMQDRITANNQSRKMGVLVQCFHLKSMFIKVLCCLAYIFPFSLIQSTNVTKTGTLRMKSKHTMINVYTQYRMRTLQISTNTLYYKNLIMLKWSLCHMLTVQLQICLHSGRV